MELRFPHLILEDCKDMFPSISDFLVKRPPNKCTSGSFADVLGILSQISRPLFSTG